MIFKCFIDMVHMINLFFAGPLGWAPQVLEVLVHQALEVDVGHAIDIWTPLEPVIQVASRLVTVLGDLTFQWEISKVLLHVCSTTLG
jgi:hypothetical protein